MEMSFFGSIKLKALSFVRSLVARVFTRDTFANILMFAAMILVSFGAGFYSLGAGLITAGVGLGVFAYFLGLE
jgi:hypothetical protein